MFLMATPRTVPHLVTALKPEALGVSLMICRGVLGPLCGIVVLPAFPITVVNQTLCQLSVAQMEKVDKR